MLFSHKKKWNFDICCNTDWYWKSYAQWSKSGTEGQTLYDFVYEVSIIAKFI